MANYNSDMSMCKCGNTYNVAFKESHKKSSAHTQWKVQYMTVQVNQEIMISLSKFPEFISAMEKNIKIQQRDSERRAAEYTYTMAAMVSAISNLSKTVDDLKDTICSLSVNVSSANTLKLGKHTMRMKIPDYNVDDDDKSE